MLNDIYNFFDAPFFVVVGGITTILALVTLIGTIYTLARGNFPVWYRVGIGLRRRKIGVFATENYDNLKDLLKDTKLFVARNIEKVTELDIDKAASYDIFLVSWEDSKDIIEKIVNLKTDKIPLIVYAPYQKNAPDKGRVDENSMELINSKRNSVVVNLRGRLLNDIFTAVITSSFEKK